MSSQDSLVHKLPVEILLNVFELLLDSAEPSNVAKLRRNVCASTSRWRSIFLTHPGLWTTIYLSFRVSMPGIRSFIQLAASRPLHIFIDFRDFHDYHPPSFEPVYLEDVVSFRLQTIIRYVSRISSFSFTTNIGGALVVAQRECHTVHAPNLRHLRISFSFRISAAYWGHYPVSWFIHPNLTTLTLRSIYIPLRTLDLAHLARLTLIMGVADLPFKSKDFIHLFDTCLRLTHLSLRDIHCDDLATYTSDRNPSRLHSRSITSLEIAFPRTQSTFPRSRSFAALFATFYIPQLKTFVLCIRSDDDVQALLHTHLSTFSSVVDLRIVVRNQIDITAIYPLFPDVIELSTQTAESFKSLLQASQASIANKGTIVMPSLTTLRLPYVAVHDLKAFIILHGATEASRSTLNTISTMPPGKQRDGTSYRLNDEELTTLDWIKNHISHFEISTRHYTPT
ncbi:hypothetical protein B0H11DRAFT_1915249 [Mycena galericulata]|nr:hypothetical protein B0H11DRAFT_1915249 [Mycena galericulata]